MLFESDKQSSPIHYVETDPFSNSTIDFARSVQWRSKWCSTVVLQWCSSGALHLQWVASHTGVPDNERANSRANTTSRSFLWHSRPHATISQQPLTTLSEKNLKDLKGQQKKARWPSTLQPDVTRPPRWLGFAWDLPPKWTICRQYGRRSPPAPNLSICLMALLQAAGKLAVIWLNSH
ncbi:hypothetical protein CDAR_514461 [Caerostris darwini]|uniref:RNase H type-1 domain-containing protein n=1 Tax=Caerostris darwini TaxID=1538125 RepID=A0AAV4RFS4_9ARAC|nr:hypothetical protein CDAR_514461 [Caerostris darwini]